MKAAITNTLTRVRTSNSNLIILNPTNPVLLIPLLLNGFILSPLFYLWLGIVLWRLAKAGKGG